MASLLYQVNKIHTKNGAIDLCGTQQLNLGN